MAQRGVDGTSMRDLAAAAGLNVASLYHYFPSKRDLLEAVLVEQGFLPVQAPRSEFNGAGPAVTNLAGLLADILVSMFDVEDFVRLMVGESIRGESTARARRPRPLHLVPGLHRRVDHEPPPRPRRARRRRRGGPAPERDGGRGVRPARRGGAHRRG